MFLEQPASVEREEEFVRMQMLVRFKWKKEDFPNIPLYRKMQSDLCQLLGKSLEEIVVFNSMSHRSGLQNIIFKGSSEEISKMVCYFRSRQIPSIAKIKMRDSSSYDRAAALLRSETRRRIIELMSRSFISGSDRVKVSCIIRSMDMINASFPERDAFHVAMIEMEKEGIIIRTPISTSDWWLSLCPLAQLRVSSQMSL